MAALQVVAAGEREQLVGVRQEPVRRAEQPGDPLQVPRAAGVQHVHGDERPARPGRRDDLRQARRRRCPPSASGPPMSSARLRRTRSRSTSASSSSDVAPGTCSAGRSPFALIGRMVADVWTPRLAGQPAGVDAVPGQRDGDHVAEQVVADRADREHVGAQLGQVDAGAGGRARGRGPDLGEPGAALAGRYGLDRPAEHVEDVRPEHGHRAERPGSRVFALTAGHGRGVLPVGDRVLAVH